jgi:aromatic ring hydroxylase
MITSAEYRKRLSKMRRNIYMGGELVDRSHPRLQGAINILSKTYDIIDDPEFKQYEDILTATSHLTGQRINRFNNVHRSMTDLMSKQKMTRLICHQVGGCVARCMGIDSTNAYSVVCYLTDQKYGTEYYRRFEKWLRKFQETDAVACCAQTDVKGNRKWRPYQQKDPDLYLRIVERKNNGIIVRGAKVHNSFAPAAEWINVLPTRALTADSMTVFDDVFIPWEHVFLCGENDMGGYMALTFALFHRHSYTGCKPAMTDVLTGATALMAEINGIEKEQHVREKISELVCTSELCYGTGIAAAINGYQSPSGTWVPDIMYCNVSRRHAGINIYHEYDILADVAGGMPATLPRYADWVSEETKPFIEKYMARNPDVDVHDVLKAFAWVQDMSCSEGAGVMQYAGVHGGGSPRMEQIAIMGAYNLENIKNIARRLAGIKTDNKYIFDRLGNIPGLQ